jgi:hypothetical protein
MSAGGAREGAGRPRQWRDRGGENKLVCHRFPVEISEDLKTIALLLDKDDPRVIAFLQSLKLS